MFIVNWWKDENKGEEAGNGAFKNNLAYDGTHNLCSLRVKLRSQMDALEENWLCTNLIPTNWN